MHQLLGKEPPNFFTCDSFSSVLKYLARLICWDEINVVITHAICFYSTALLTLTSNGLTFLASICHTITSINLGSDDILDLVSYPGRHIAMGVDDENLQLFTRLRSIRSGCSLYFCSVNLLPQLCFIWQIDKESFDFLVHSVNIVENSEDCG